MDNNRPIGIFDSGIGGLTIARAIREAFPQENIVYFGDTAHLPYGDKSPDTIYSYARDIVDFLVDQGCKIIVVACNSASAAAYDRLVDYVPQDVDLINVIDPMAEYVVKQDLTTVGVIATKATIASGVYQKKIHALRKDMQVHSLATPLLAPMIEEGYYRGEISSVVLKEYLSDSTLESIEGLVLACTHYPLIREEIDTYYNGKIHIYDSTTVIVDKVTEALTVRNIDRGSKEKSTHTFYVSDLTASFEKTTRLFYGRDVHLSLKNISK